MRHDHHFRWGTANKIAGALGLLFGFSAILWAAGGALSGIVTGANGVAIAGARV